MPDVILETGEWIVEVNPAATIVEVDSDIVSTIEVGGSQGPSGEIALAAHVAATDPHPQYVDAAELATAIASVELTDEAKAELRDRATHTGVQAIGTVTGLQTALDGKASSAQGSKADTALQPSAIGVTVQAVDADLDAIANLATTGLIERTGNGTAVTASVTAYIKSLLQAVDAASAKAILEVGASGRMPYSLVDRSGVTSAIANAWTQIIVLTSLSNHLFVMNPIGATSTLEIGVGGMGVEFKIFVLTPGKSARVESRDRISIRCSLTTQPYLANEAVYI